jgi:hypothetical protein
LRQFLDLRIAFYEEDNARRVAEIGQQTAIVQGKLWSAVLPTAASQPTPTTVLVVSGTNDVINAQGYTQAAWWNWIPSARGP